MSSQYTVDYETLAEAGKRLNALADDLETCRQGILEKSNSLEASFDTQDYKNYADQTEALCKDLGEFREKVEIVGRNLVEQSQKYQEIAERSAGIASKLETAA